MHKTKIIFLSGIVVILIIISVYYYFISRLAINIPFADEYFSALGFIHKFNDAAIYDRIFMIFRQVNEHRVVFFNLSITSQYLLFGHINFYYLNLLGNAFLVGLFIALFKQVKNTQNKTLWSIPIVLILFVPMPEISDWGAESICTIVVYFFVLISLILLNKEKNIHLFFSALFALIVTFAFGNGMFVFPAGYIILFLSKAKSKKKSIIWTVVMILSVGLYFHDYHINDNLNPLNELIRFPVGAIKFFLLIPGSFFIPFSTNITILAFAGLGLLFASSAIIFVRFDYIKKNPVLIAFIVFFLISLIAATLTRMRFGIGAATAPRYLIIVAIMIVCVYIISVDSLKNASIRVLAFAIIGSAILYAARLSFNLNYMERHRSVLCNDIASFYADPEKFTLPYFNRGKWVSRVLATSIADSFYLPPTISEMYPAIRLCKSPMNITETNSIIYYFDEFKDSDEIVKIRGWAILPGETDKKGNIKILLKSTHDKVCFTTQPVARPDVIKVYGNKTQTDKEFCGFDFVVGKHDSQLDTGYYRVGIILVDSMDEWQLKYSDNYLRIQK
jgi:hypothetical protein